jgi:hypothetical protein
MPSVSNRSLPLLLLSILSSTAVADAPATMPATVPATLPATAPAIITWDQAKDHVGQLAIVTGPVVGTHDLGDAAVLNVGKDFPDRGRFTVYISAEKRKGVPDDLYEGKTITVDGTIKLFHHVPEIEAGAEQITVVPQAATAPSSAPATQP